VIIDATLICAVLVPACQRILGRTAWYAPAPLHRLNTRIGLTEACG
jgi:RND superfamily putative drug exporter